MWYTVPRFRLNEFKENANKGTGGGNGLKMKPKVIITIVVGLVIMLLTLILFHNSVSIGIAGMQKDLPMKIDEGMTLTEVYESGNTVFYVVVVDTEISREDLQISQNDIEEDKQAIIAEFKREMGRDMKQFKRLVDGIVYLYKNNNGEELYSISISNSEL